MLLWIRMRTFFLIQTGPSNAFDRPSINIQLGVIQNKIMVCHRLCETTLQATDDPEAVNYPALNKVEQNRAYPWSYQKHMMSQ